MARWCIAALTAAIAVACTSAREPALTSDEVTPPATLAELSARAPDVFRLDGGEWTSRAARIGSDGTVRLGTLALRTEGDVRSVRRTANPSVVVVDHGTFDERLASHGATLEQAWTFASRPLGPIRVATAGMRWVAATSTGQHFVDEATGRRVRYGNATWIDAAGTRTPVPVTREGDDLVLAVPERAAAGPYPAVLDPTIGPEVGIDTPVADMQGGSQSVRAALGPAGTYLVTWQDFDDAGVRAIRVAANGTPIGKPFTVGHGNADGVAWDPTGQRWLVAMTGKDAIYVARVAANGTLLDAVPKAIPATAPNDVRVAFDGTQFLVAYHLYAVTGTPSKIVTQRVSSATGTPDAASALTIATSASLQDVSCAGAAGCAVAWSSESGSTAWLSRIGANNALLDANGIALGAGFTAGAAVGTDGTQWLAAWSEYQSGVYHLKTARVAANGTVTAGSELDPSGATQASVTWDGTNFLVAWKRGSYPLQSSYARHVTTAGAAVEANPVFLTSSSILNDLTAISDGASALFVWWDSSRHVVASAYSLALAATTPGGQSILSFGSNSQRRVAAAWNGSAYLAVWIDSRTQNGLYAARVSATGAPLDAAATSLGSAAGDVAVASDGSGFLVVWNNLAQILATRVGGGSNAPLDATPLVVASANAQFAPQVAWDGKQYVVVWTTSASSPLTARDVVGARVTPAGAILDPGGFTISAANADQVEPAIASDGTGSFVAWSDFRTDYYDGDLWGSRVSQAGVALDPGGILVARRGQGQMSARVARAKGGYAVAWLDDGAFTLDVYATRVTSAGTVSDTQGTLVAKTTANTMTLADMQDGSLLAAWSTSGPDFGPRVEGAWLRDGTALETLDTPPIGLTGAAGAMEPAVAPAGPGAAGLFFTRFDDDGSARVHFRAITSGSANGAACAVATDCATRYCTDAVCCVEKCDGPCQRCGANGACEPVKSADDPGACDGENTCSADGACRRRPGSVCATAADCASGFCVDSVCCATACDGACETCAETRGTCTPLPRGTLGTPSCSPNRCDGKSGACATTCEADADCADGFGCDRPTKTCIAGSVCVDGHTVRETNGAIQSCLPYACRSGKCAPSCTSVVDCAFPAVCDEAGHCVSPPGEVGGGCTVGARGGSGPWLAVALGLLVARRRRRR